MAQRAGVALGRLSGVTGLLPDSQLFLYSYVRKEAVLSSQIEGTQSSLSELLLFENDAASGVPLGRCYRGLQLRRRDGARMKRLAEGFPLSLRLIKEVHAVLLAKGRGSEKQPGEFRTLPKLDWRLAPRQRPLRSAPARPSPRVHGLARTLPAQSRRALPRPCRPRPRAIRDHPPLPRRATAAPAASSSQCSSATTASFHNHCSTSASF